MEYQVPRPACPQKGCLRAQAEGWGGGLGGKGSRGKTDTERSLAIMHLLCVVIGGLQFNPINDHKHDGDWGASASALSWINKGKGVLKCALCQNMWVKGILLPSLDVSRSTGLREDSHCHLTTMSSLCPAQHKELSLIPASGFNRCKMTEFLLPFFLHGSELVSVSDLFVLSC